LNIKGLYYLILSIALLGAALLISQQEFTKVPPKKAARDLEKRIHEKESFLETYLASLPLSEDSCRNPKILLDHTRGQFEKNGSLFLLYQDDSLIFWSENKAPFPLQYDSVEFCSPLVELANGHYLMKSRNQGKFTWMGLYLIRANFPYENDYLRNDFNKDLHFSGNYPVSMQNNGSPVSSRKGEILFYLHPAPEKYHSELIQALLLTLYLGSFFFFWIWAFAFFGKISFFRERKLLFLALFTLDVLLIRTLLFYFRIPGDLYQTTLFSPLLYASSSILPSLGDLLVNMLCLLFLGILWLRNRSHLRCIRDHKTRFLVSLAIHTAIFCFVFFYKELYKGLVLNSNIPLDLTNPVAFSANTLYALVITAAGFTGLFFIALSLLSLVNDRSSDYRTNAIAAGIAAFVLVPLMIYRQGNIVLILTFSLFVLASLHLAMRNNRVFLRFPALLIILLGFAIFSTFILSESLQKKEHALRRQMAAKLSVERDPIAEYLIQEQYNNMQQDRLLKQDLLAAVFSEIREKNAVEYLQKKYFQEYWSKYNLTITLCYTGRMLNVVVPDNALVDCGNFFFETIRNVGKPTSTPLLFYLDYGNESINYLAELPFSLATGDYKMEMKIYVDIVSKQIPKGLGYPELLMGKNAGFGPDLNQYSYAIYDQSSLVRSNGKFAYGLKHNFGGFGPDQFSSYTLDGYNHLAYLAGAGKVIVISMLEKSWRDYATPLSYLLAFYTVFFFLVLLIAGYVHIPRFAEMNFSNRLQLYMISLILSAFIITGYVTYRYINSLYGTKNIQNLQEKTHSVLSEMQQRMVQQGPLTPELGNDLYFLLNKYSLIFFTDINLYDLHGNLMASSRPQIFEEGLLSTKMDNPAYYALNSNRKSSFIQQEKIGNYSFLSAYMPMRNGQDELIGYLNLPYFAKQGEIRMEIATFFVAFLNIYVMLIVLAVIIALFIANYIAQPLRLIREKLSRVKLGKSNEKLGWIRKDEIGLLVEEYNNMIDKLAQSADQLAQSERESAWREMARQVAHEIKNPLTPMKLSVQLLQRAWDENEPDWDRRLRRFSVSLTEQIDTLSAIASEFSDFAQMPQSRLESLKLEEIIQNAIDLFHNQEIFDAKFIMADPPPFIVRADRKQLHRVFSNLFRNSIQAFPPGEKGIITITLHKSHHSIRLEFRDNGHGIPQEQQERIFSPNFTTKSGGMGLGLSMVKSILQECGAEISFHSEEGIGTTFTLVFPLAD
jgi:signal transduction histidine kinase